MTPQAESETQFERIGCEQISAVIAAVNGNLVQLPPIDDVYLVEDRIDILGSSDVHASKMMGVGDVIRRYDSYYLILGIDVDGVSVCEISNGDHDYASFPHQYIREDFSPNLTDPDFEVCYDPFDLRANANVGGDGGNNETTPKEAAE